VELRDDYDIAELFETSTRKMFERGAFGVGVHFSESRVPGSGHFADEFLERVARRVGCCGINLQQDQRTARLQHIASSAEKGQFVALDIQLYEDFAGERGPGNFVIEARQANVDLAVPCSGRKATVQPANPEFVGMKNDAWPSLSERAVR